MAQAGTVWKSPKEVAELLELVEKTVRRWCQRGLVECELTPSGKNWRVKCRADDGFPVRT